MSVGVDGNSAQSLVTTGGDVKYLTIEAEIWKSVRG